ncbi:palmitoyltransferase ZDHHC6-like [Paramacrobiotus metropolitanus]|uniref:palmitoyltransferase ZDHHC6-like n=1 Tax=Paramacrobiotus metropolitanus TaxID=2943436 RepID=UPI002445707C|nr:palmitoyltransferase ZDHHC6-like [Paramacrobiotus metropolitanus]
MVQNIRQRSIHPNSKDNGTPVLEEKPSLNDDLPSKVDIHEEKRTLGKPANVCSRMLYWGTLLAQFIITSVSLTFLYSNTYFFPVMGPRGDISLKGLLHLIVFCASSVLTQYNFLMAIFIGPGYVPERWQPEKEKHNALLQYCKVCLGFKAPRAHHCRTCGRCVLKMEHHCPWINNCVGHKNHAYFLRFLFFAVVGCAHAAFVFLLIFLRLFTISYSEMHFGGRARQSSNLLVHSYHKLMYFQPPPAFFNIWGLLWLVLMIGFAVGVTIAVGLLCIVQLKIIFRNETSIERWIITKANHYLREEAQGAGKPVALFRNPYDLGWKENFRQVIGNGSRNPQGDGIWWAVHDSCDQFTLTSEQLRQKQFKRDASVVYEVRESYNGARFPLFSQGFGVCIAFPWALDEPRIAVQSGDRIRVTFGKNKWLYGELLGQIQADRKLDPSGDSHKERKGWFPRRVAVPLQSESSSFL